MLKRAVLSVVAAAAALGGCRDGGGEGAPDGRLVIAADVPAYAAIARALAPEGAEVLTLVDPMVSPHVFNPAPSTVSALAGADVVVVNGLELAPALERQARASARGSAAFVVVADALGIGGEDAHGHGHAHGEGAHHQHAVDPHLWLDPMLMYEAVGAIGDAVVAAMEREGMATGEAVAGVEERRAALLEAVLRVDGAFATRLGAVETRTLVTHHDALSRLADRYGLEVRAVIQPSAGVDPAPSVVDMVLGLARDGEIRAIFVEPQLPGGAARRLAELAGVPLVEINPLAEGPYEARMMELLGALEAGLGGGAHNAAQDE